MSIEDIKQHYGLFYIILPTALVEDHTGDKDYVIKLINSKEPFYFKFDNNDKYYYFNGVGILDICGYYIEFKYNDLSLYKLKNVDELINDPTAEIYVTLLGVGTTHKINQLTMDLYNRYIEYKVPFKVEIFKDKTIENHCTTTDDYIYHRYDNDGNLYLEYKYFPTLDINLSDFEKHSNYVYNLLETV